MRGRTDPRTRLRCALALLLLVALAPASAFGQQGFAIGQPPEMSNFLGAPITGGSSQAADESESLGVLDSYVSFIDSAMTRNVVRTRLDFAYTNRQPTRAEFFQAKGGLPFSPGPPLPESRVDYQELSTYAEYAPLPFFSVFAETPFRWINPEANRNDYGFGDTNFGLKLVTWSDAGLLATLQLRFYNPTARRAGLGTQHWTIEPGLLASFQPYDNITFEGEVRYWVPLGGTDFAGDVLRYGLGLSLGERKDAQWVMPVVEAVGWNVMGGQTLVATAPDSFAVRDAEGQTILNGYLGCRFGYGHQVDFYAGYGRCFTGNAWFRDFVRLEMRVVY